MATKPPALTDDSIQQASQVPEGQVGRDPTERVLGMGVTPGGSLDRALQQHHQARTAQAQMYRSILANKLSQIYHKNEYFDPQTQQTRALTDQEVSDLQAQADEAEKNYNKIIGVNPESKDALGKARQIIDFVTGHKHAQAQQRPGGFQTPPTPQYGSSVMEGGVVPTPAPGANVGEAGMAISPPPTPQRQPSVLQQSMTSQFGQHRQQVGQGIEDYRRSELGDADTRRALVDKVIPKEDQKKAYVQDFILTGKITGNMGALLRPPPRPVGSYTTSVLDARSRAGKTGEVFMNVAGEPIDIDSLDPSMGLKGMQTLDPTTGQWQVRYEPFSPNQATVTVGNEEFAVNPMDKSKLGAGAGAALGPKAVQSTTATRDPATGQTTVSTKTPKTTGLATGAAPSGGGPATITPPPVSGRVSSAPAGEGKPSSLKLTTPITEAVLPKLDDSGHIPATVIPASTPQIVEGANQLLDGKDVKDLPAKTKELSANMARRYGWEQGKFTPREQGALRNATQFIDDMLSNPSTFAVLDSTMSRLKLNQVLAGADKQGPLASAASTLASSNMNDDEAKFVRQYNIITQTLAGIAPAIRGSGNRTTEAAIQRLITDMPNPKTTQGAKDGMERLQLLKKEIQRALAKGTFTESDLGKTSGTAKVPAALTPSGGRPPLSSFEH